MPIVIWVWFPITEEGSIKFRQKRFTGGVLLYSRCIPTLANITPSTHRILAWSLNEKVVDTIDKILEEFEAEKSSNDRVHVPKNFELCMQILVFYPYSFIKSPIRALPNSHICTTLNNVSQKVRNLLIIIKIKPDFAKSFIPRDWNSFPDMVKKESQIPLACLSVVAITQKRQISGVL